MKKTISKTQSCKSFQHDKFLFRQKCIREWAATKYTSLEPFERVKKLQFGMAYTHQQIGCSKKRFQHHIKSRQCKFFVSTGALAFQAVHSDWLKILVLPKNLHGLSLNIVRIQSPLFYSQVHTANVYKDLQVLYREIRVRGFQIYGGCG